jgi:hypothetical protein
MHVSLRAIPHVLAAAVVAAPAVAQQCTWISYPWGGNFTTLGAALYDSNQQRILYINQGVNLWTWNGQTWQWIDGLGPNRTRFAAAYDSHRERIVLFGGTYGAWYSYRDETFEWDGVLWQLVADDGPPHRERAGMVYDPHRHSTILYGGATDITNFGDTWEWNGQTWNLAAASGPPPGPSFQLLTFDSLRNRAVLYRGHDQLWEWDGFSWQHRSIPTSGHDANWILFDPARNRYIVSLATPSRPSTWELDSDSPQWHERSPGTGPNLPFAFDTSRGRAVGVATSRAFEFDPAGEIAPPAVVRHPTGVPYSLGATITLTAEIIGSTFQLQWMHNNEPLLENERITGVHTLALTIRDLSHLDNGNYRLQAANACWDTSTNSVSIWLPHPPVGCYPNCDGSDVQPILNIADFSCFLQKFAAGDPYANCDNSYSEPVLNVADFSCFLGKFAAGCQ